jgi:hypothetical protein
MLHIHDSCKFYVIQFLSPDTDAKKGPGIGVPGGGTGGQAAQDPIGALQNLARQGTLKVGYGI